MSESVGANEAGRQLQNLIKVQDAMGIVLVLIVTAFLLFIGIQLYNRIKNKGKKTIDLPWFKQPFVIFIFLILVILIIGQTYFFDIVFLLTPFMLMGIGIYSIIIGIHYFNTYKNKLLGIINLIFGILIILSLILILYVFTTTIST